MNYYIQGNPTKAQQIKAAFEKLGINVLDFGFADKTLVYCSIGGCGGCVQYLPYSINLMNILYSHPDYQELQLQVQPRFKVVDKVVYKGKVCTITFMDEVYYDFDGGVAGCRIELQDWLLRSAPKFEVGDWIVSTRNQTLAYRILESNIINELGNLAYKVEIYSDGIYEKTCLIPSDKMDEWGRLWTIADAKDGDVITNGKLIVIFNKLEEPVYRQHIIAYVGLDLCDKLQITEDTWQLGVDKAVPATKEQRDLLFQKMKEAGYEWDEKKKELRKIQPHYDIKNFKPKQWVLVRDDDEWGWDLTRFSYLSNGSASLFVCINGASFQQCIPYEGNEHLLGTTDMCDEQYINW